MGQKPNIGKLSGKLLQRLSKLMTESPFYLQSQMDIHPRSRYFNPGIIEKTGGFYIPGDIVKREIISLKTYWDQVRRDMLVLILKDLLIKNVKGDLAELGVYRGYTAKLIHYYVPERELFLFDTYEGFDKSDLDAEQSRTGYSIGSHFRPSGVADVREYIKPKNDNITFIRGAFPGSVPEQFETRTFAFVHVDMDLYDPTAAALTFFYPRMSRGGYLVIHDYNTWSGARDAVDEFFSGKPESPVPMPDKNGSAVIKKL